MHISLTDADIAIIDTYREGAKCLTGKRPTRVTAIRALIREAGKSVDTRRPIKRYDALLNAIRYIDAKVDGVIEDVAKLRDAR